MDKQLIEVLIPLIGDKKEVKIADIGSGPVSRIGQHLEEVKVEIYPSDKQNFPQIEYQDMEKLTYPDNFFDIVYCSNALDHTRNALAAVKEMIRVCKIGGWVYIECWLDQLQTGYKHYWDAKEEGVFINKIGDKFDLKDYSFKIKFINDLGERRYNRIIATLEKNKESVNGN